MLREADNHKPVPFIEFTARCGQAAFHLLGASLQAAAAPEPEDSLNRLHLAYYTRAGLTYEELDTRAGTLLKNVQTILSGKLQTAQQNGAPFKDVSWSMFGNPQFEPSRPEMRTPRNPAAFGYAIVMTPPISVAANGLLQLEMPRNAQMMDQIFLMWRPVPDGAPREVFKTGITDLLNPNNPRLQMQIELSLEYVVREILAELAKKAESHRQKI